MSINPQPRISVNNLAEPHVQNSDQVGFANLHPGGGFLQLQPLNFQNQNFLFVDRQANVFQGQGHHTPRPRRQHDQSESWEAEDNLYSQKLTSFTFLKEKKRRMSLNNPISTCDLKHERVMSDRCRVSETLQESEFFHSYTCSVCIQDFKRGEALSRLACRHAFHLLCVAKWLDLRRTANCPICRQPAF